MNAAMGSISDDEISLTSTVESDQQSEYEVETILAEHNFPDGMRYLVRWAGYSDDRSTWEPADAFAANETLLDWETKKQQVAAGKGSAFDVAAWEARLLQIEEEKNKRKDRRAAKRRKIALTQLSRTDESVNEAANQRTIEPKGPKASKPRPPDPSSKPLFSDRVHPSRQGLSGPSSSRNPPILFANSQTAPDRSRLKKPPITDNGKMFTHLSTQYKHGKRLKREPPPDIHQLDLRRPSEWTSMSPINTTPLGGSRFLPDTADNSPIGYGTGLKLSPKSKSDSVSIPRPKRDETSNPPPKFFATKDEFSTSTSEFNLEVPRRIPGPNAYVVPYHPSRWWYKTDVYVTMYFGRDKVDIGNVRLCDLAVETRKRLLRTKVGKEVEVWFRDLCTLDEYNELCTRSRRNSKFANGWVEGFDDTEPAIRQAAVTLWQNNLVAIAQIDHGCDLLAYPPGSPHFGFLDDGTLRTKRGYLNLACRPALGRMEWLRSRSKDNHFQLTEVTNSSKSAQFGPMRVNAASNSKTHRSRDVSQENIGQSPIASPTLESPVTAFSMPSASQSRPNHQYPVDKPTMQQRSSHLSTEMMEHDVQPARAQGSDYTIPKADAAIDLDEIFRVQFKTTFEALANINSGEKGKSNRVEAVFVWFPEDSELVRKEKELLLEFLQNQKPKPQIFLNGPERDWDNFTAACTKWHGALLLHESFVDYDKIPSFKDFLLRPSACWNVSLSRPLEPVDRGLHFQRLFPHGGVILLTEDFMVRDTDATMITLEWFLEWTKKKFPGSWKIMLRPDVLNWVLKQVERSDAKLSKWLAIYRLLRQLGLNPSDDLLSIIEDDPIDSLVISPPKLPKYGFRGPDDSPNIPRDCGQDYRNADHLAEFFAGWCLINAHRFRKFTMVTTLKPLERWAKWQHVDIRSSVRDFFNAPLFQIDYKPIWAKMTGAPKSNSAPDPASYTPRTPKLSNTSTSEHRTGLFASQAPVAHKYAQPYR